MCQAILDAQPQGSEYLDSRSEEQWVVLKPCLQVIFLLAWLLREDGCFPLTVDFL